MTTLRDRYPEILAEDHGANSLKPAGRLEQVVQDLDCMGQACRTATLPSHLEALITTALRERAVMRARRGGHPRPILIFRRRPLALVTAAVLGLLTIVGATYAAVPVLTRVFDLAGAGNVITQNLGKEVNLSQTLAGYTMTIKRVYADPNRVLIAYNIQRPPTDRRVWDLSAVTVVNAAGAILPTRGGAGDGGNGEPDTTLQWFDAAGIAGHPKELRLHITVPWIDGMERLHAPPAAEPSRPIGQESPATVTSTVATAQAFPGLPTSGAYGSVATARPIGVRDSWMQEIRIYGPISFDLTIPYQSARETQPNQHVMAGGVTAVLKRVVISPTEMRIYVGGLEPNTFGILSTDGWDAGGTESTEWRSGDTSVYSFLAPLMDKHGQWTLVIRSGPVLHLPAGLAAPPGSTLAKGGPWTFHFTVP